MYTSLPDNLNKHILLLLRAALFVRMDIKHRPVKAAVNCVQKAIEQSIEARPLNALITETFHVAREQRESAMKSGLDTFPVVVKDCFA